MGETVKSKLLTLTGKGELGIDDATEVSSNVLVGRMHMPYPPGDMKIGTLYFPSLVQKSNHKFSITWAHRNRIQQTNNNIIGFFSTSVTTEPLVTYSCELKRVDNGTLIGSFVDEIGGSFEFTNTYIGNVEIELWSVREGVECRERLVHQFLLN